MFERWGEQYSELTNNLDFNIIVHQSRNIVKGMQKKNNAEHVVLQQILDKIKKKEKRDRQKSDKIKLPHQIQIRKEAYLS